jgi:hypothetical protein
MKHLDGHNLYKDSWQGEIVEEAFAHPAKYARGMIRATYDYLIEQGYLRPGDTVIDPFAGVGLGGLDAMRYGLHWTGCELEPRFVELARQNIALWERRYRPHFPAWGTARILQGDSRNLATLVGAADGVISSPPYASDVIRSRDAGQHEPNRQGAMRNGGHCFDEYGRTPGQLGSMPEGHFNAALTSPPYAETVNGSGEGPGARHDPIYHNGDNAYKQSSAAEYGRTPGNLGNMAGGFDAAISSPPYEGCDLGGGGGILVRDDAMRRSHGFSVADGNYSVKGQTNGQLGNDQGATFWSAARQILEQTYQVLRPGAVAVFVCGDFVRDRQRVYFGRQWMALCEAVGFVGLEWITAWKTETHGTQYDIFGNGHERKVDRVSFFRRLANEKNPDAAILNEDVIIMRRPASHSNGYHANGNGHK